MGYTSSAGTHDAFYHYDDHDRLTKLGDWIDNTDGLQYGYDAYGRLTRLIDYDGSDLNYTYDTLGRVVSMNDYHGNTTTYGYDALGRFTSLTAPGSKTWSYAYDGYGRLTRVDIPNGMHTEYGYDGIGRQTSIHYKDGATLKQGFDYEFATGGNITRIDHEDGSYWEYAYDGRDQLTKAERGNTASPTILAVYKYVYDAGGNMVTKEVPWYDDFQDGNITGWSGNTTYYSVVNGALENTVDSVNWRDLYLSETDADHDLSYRFMRQTSAGVTTARLRFTDGDNQLYLQIHPTSVALHQRDGGTLTTLGTLSTTVAQNTWYNVRAVLEGSSVKVWFGAEGASFDEIFSATTTELATATAAFFRASTNSEFAWDDIRLIAGTRGTVETFTHNNANEQLTYTKNGVTTDMEYDAWGRLTRRDDGTHEATYAYRYGSKLYSVTSDFPGEGNVTYETGGDQKRRSRVAGVEETWYNYTVGFDVVSTENDADGMSGALTMTNVVAAPTAPVSATLGDLAGTTPASGTARYYAFDHLGSTRSVWNASKVEVGNYGFDPYGGEFAHAGGALNSLAAAYTGKPWDGSSGLFHFPYRQYSPDTARWTTRDPLGMVDGPNVYVYIRSGLMNRIDILGLSYGLPDWTDPFNPLCWFGDCDDNSPPLPPNPPVPTAPKPSPFNPSGRVAPGPIDPLVTICQAAPALAEGIIICKPYACDIAAGTRGGDDLDDVLDDLGY